MRALDQRREVFRVRDRQRRFQSARGEEQVQQDATVRESRRGLPRAARRSRPGFLPQHQAAPAQNENASSTIREEFMTRADAAIVAQTSKSAVSQVSKPARR